MQKLLDAQIMHRVIDVTTDPQGRAYLDSIDAKSVPVVVADGYNPIVGYQPDLLKYMIETLPKGHANV